MSDMVQLKLGLADHQSGRLDRAVARYRSILCGAPANGDAMYLLGMAMTQMGHASEARAYLERTVSIQPLMGVFQLSLGNARRDVGDRAGARAALEAAVQLRPGDAESRNALGLALREFGDIEGAIRSFDTGLALEPEDPGLGYNRAMTLQLSGRLEDAIRGYDFVLGLNPDQVDAINNRARALQELGRADEAVDELRRLLVSAPNHQAGWNNLGISRRASESLELALEAFERALSIEPNNGEIHNNLGAVAWALGDEGRAISAYERAKNARPGIADANLNLAFALAGQGHHEAAVLEYESGASQYPDDPRFPIRRALSLPQVCRSVEEISGLRADLDGFLDSEQARLLRVDDPILAVGGANFYRVYHGLDDRPAAERIAQFHRRCCPRLSWVAPHCRDGRPGPSGKRPRLGICSKYLNLHTIGLLFGGVIERLAARGDFEIVILRPPGRQDEISRRIDAAADHVIQLPARLAQAQEAIADARVDALLYTDIGMEPITYFLAFSRLAPVQFVTWGHPVTTGLSSLDGYLSANFFEPKNGEPHYTEGLKRLGNILMYYEPPNPGTEGSKVDFGLPAKAPAYVCPQNVFKLHPEFDGWVADILRADPTGRVVLIEGGKDGWTQRLRGRLDRSMPDVVDRVVFLPYLSTKRYFELLVAADVILDPIHFGGGNTTFHALSLGTPLITTPGPFQRSRFASGTYRAIGMQDLIARDRDDYVARAVTLGIDPASRQRASARIRDAARAIQRRHEPADELGDLLLEAIETRQ
jgi:protein O-GlcNAc transferase